MKTKSYPETYTDKEANRLRRLAAKEEFLGNARKASRIRRQIYDLTSKKHNPPPEVL